MNADKSQKIVYSLMGKIPGNGKNQKSRKPDYRYELKMFQAGNAVLL